MHSSMLVAVIATLAAVAVKGRTSSICPRVTHVPSYDASKGLGTWYIIAYSTCTIAMPNVKCQVMTFSPKDDRTAHFKMTATDLKTNSKIVYEGTLVVDKDNPTTWHPEDSTTTTYTVTDIEYNKYATVMYQQTVNGIPGSILLVFSKEKEITDPNIVKNYKQAVSRAGFDTDDLQRMAQTGCSTD